MSATYWYQVYVGNTEPSRPNLASIWVHCSVGEVKMRVGRAWIQIAGFEPITVFTEQYKWLSQKVGTVPTAEIGKMWLDTGTNQNYIYITDWALITGG